MGAKWRKLRHRYGLARADYERLAEKFNGTCWICYRTCSSGKALAVDHCHTTGRVRGLLCANCNHAIGKLGDDPVRAFRLMNYLRFSDTLLVVPGVV